MIHIDELFRHRMEDREASPGPGAWSNMRSLLDKELPVTPAATSWRRIFGYFTGVLLLASASVGGYSLYSDQLQSNLGTAPSALRASNTVIAGGITPSAMAASSGAAALRDAAVTGRTATGAAGSASTVSASSGPAAAQALPEHRSGSGRDLAANMTASVNPGSGTFVADASTASGSDAISATSGTRTRRTTRETYSAATSNGARRTAAVSTSTTNASVGTELASSARPHSSADVLPNAGTRRAPATTSDALAATATGTRKNQPNTASSATRPELQPLNSGVATSNTPPAMVRRLDTIQRIEIIGRLMYAAGSRRPVYRLDTLPTEYVVVERLIPVVPMFAAESKSDAGATQIKRRTVKKNAATSASENVVGAVSSKPGTTDPILASSMTSKSSEETNSASELAGKISGNHLNFWQSLRLDEKVEKAKASLQSVQLYPGVIAGINMTMFTPNSLGGFQLGLTSLIAINDYWSVLGELKYVHRFNTGSSVRDDYYNVDESTVTPVTVTGREYNRYEWKEAKVDHYFNYETIQTIELPVMLRYNNNRFFAQSGVNFVSSRAIGAREVTNQAGAYVPHGGVLMPASSTETPLPSTKPSVTMADFGSRLGLGYTLGAGYMFTPSVFFDFRMTQTFWDNANTPGALRISQDLLRKPSFQISVGYRFGTAKERP